MKKQLPSAPKQRSTRAYAYALAREPVAWGSAVLVMLAGGATSALVAAPALIAITAATCIAASRPAVRQYVDARQQRERARRRREERETRLEDARADREGLASLTLLAEQVTRCDPVRAEVLELDALLDRYTDAAVALACHRRTLSAIDVGRLQRLRASLDGTTPRGALVARRLDLWVECQERSRILEEELATIHELFALAAQRALAGPVGPGADVALEEQLARLDALET